MALLVSCGAWRTAADSLTSLTGVTKQAHGVLLVHTHPFQLHAADTQPSFPTTRFTPHAFSLTTLSPPGHRPSLSHHFRPSPGRRLSPAASPPAGSGSRQHFRWRREAAEGPVRPRLAPAPGPGPGPAPGPTMRGPPGAPRRLPAAPPPPPAPPAAM